MRTVLTTHLWPHIGLDDPRLINKSFSSDKRWLGKIAACCVCYDSMVVPTYDFGILPGLIKWFTLPLFVEALQSGRISFVRIHGEIGYAGNGGGLVPFLIGEGERKFEWWQNSVYGETPVSLDLQIGNALDNLTSVERRLLSDEVSRATRTIKLGDDEPRKAVLETTYLDVSGTEEIARLIYALTGSKTELSANSLPGIRGDQIRISGETARLDAIGVVLSVARTNLEIFVSSCLDNCEPLTWGRAGILFKNKMSRIGISKNKIDGFFQIMDLRGIPDLERAVGEGRVEFHDIWTLGQKRAAVQFRNWLAEARPADARELARQYIQVIAEGAPAAGTYTKALRWIVPKAAGLLADYFSGPAGGAVAEAAAGKVDEWIANRYLHGNSPKFLVDELRALRIEPRL